MHAVKKLLKVVLFAALAVLMLRGIQTVFYAADDRSFHSIAGFYQEPENSLDAVFIGASNTFEFFQPPVAWEDHGIAVYNYTAPAMPTQGLKYVMKEVYQKQPDALLIVNLNKIKNDEFKYAALHYFVDFIPFSANKIALIRELAPSVGIESFWDQLEFCFPIIRFHSRWPDLRSDEFYRVPTGKGASSDNAFINGIVDYTGLYRTSEQRNRLSSEQEAVVNDMLAFCAENPEAKVLFVFVPQIQSNADIIGQYNAIADQLTEAGLDVLNAFSAIDGIGVDLRGDFFDSNHFNVHGSLKFTEYFAHYLIEKYGFTDKRGDPAYASWAETAENYDAIVATGALDYERAHAVMDYTLDFPALTGCEAYGSDITVTWEPVAGADAYLVYQRPKNGVWERIAETGDTVYTDSGLEIDREYAYTVIPIKNTAEGPVYGSYNKNILSAKTTIPAPLMTEIWEDENGITVKWEAVSFEKDYYVYRRELDSDQWIKIAESVKTTYYTDRGAKPGISYAYAAAAYTNDIDGAHDPVGLIIERDK